MSDHILHLKTFVGGRQSFETQTKRFRLIQTCLILIGKPLNSHHRAPNHPRHGKDAAIPSDLLLDAEKVGKRRRVRDQRDMPRLSSRAYVRAVLLSLGFLSLRAVLTLHRFDVLWHLVQTDAWRLSGSQKADLYLHHNP